MPETDQPQDHLTEPPRQQTSDPIAPVFEHGQSSDPNIASFSQAQETNDVFTSTNVDDEPLGGYFHAFPPRSTQASPAAHTLGGAEDPITLTALSSVVSTLVQKVNSLETELKAHKKLFKDVVGKLVKQVKAMEVKLKIKKRKVVVSDSDKEDGGEQDVDLDALHALANSAVIVDSTKSPGGASSNPPACSDVPTSDVPTTNVPTDVPSGVAPPGPLPVSPCSTTVPTSSSVPAAKTISARSGTTTATPSSPIRDARKGKGVAVEEPTPTKDKTFKQLEEERLARQMSQDFEMTEDQRKRQQETMAQVRKLSHEQRQEEFDKIQRAVAFTRGLKRDGSPMTTDFSKKLKPSDVEVDVEAPSHGVPQENISEAQAEVPSQEAIVEDVEVPSNIASKAQQTASSLKKVEGDLDAEHKLCIKYASDEDSASDCDTPVYLYAVVDWELLPTGLGSINAIYRLDNSRKYFTSLREILHLVTRADLMRNLKILMDSPEVNDGISGLVIHMFVDKKYPLTINLIERMLNHQLEICHGTVGNELTTTVQLIAFLKKQISDSKRPKVHEWVINSPCYHNKELASPEQTATAAVVPKSVARLSVPAASSMLLLFGVQICAEVSYVQVKTQADWMLYVVPTGRVVVPTGRYVVSAGKVIIIVSPGRLSLVPTGSILSPVGGGGGTLGGGDVGEFNFGNGSSSGCHGGLWWLIEDEEDDEVDEMMNQAYDGRKLMRRSDRLFHDHIGVNEFVLERVGE
ncbi:hypothetical protein Tco_0797350 [Tanacetum coccineum]